MSNDTIALKRCTKCGEEKPATTEYFNRHKRNKCGLRAECNLCRRKYRQLNKAAETNRSRKYTQAHREKVAEYQHNYYLQNKERLVEYYREYYEKNKNHLIIRARRYYWQHHSACRDRRRKYHQTHLHFARTAGYLRRKRMRLLPNTFTGHEWQRCLEYFNGCCAVCGKQLRDLFATHKPSADHWIPLVSAECPGTVAGNIVPLCHGQKGCNNRKHHKLPEQWLTETYGKRKAAEILRRITAYFEWVKNQ